MGGVNPVIQLAAALDRRGITVSIDGDRVHVHIGPRERMAIRRRAEGIPSHQLGREWSWQHGAQAGCHPVTDYEGAADAVEKALRGMPDLAGTSLLHRMDHLGWTWEQESGKHCGRHEPRTAGRLLMGEADRGVSIAQRASFGYLQALEDAIAYRQARVAASCPDCGAVAIGQECDDHACDLELIAAYQQAAHAAIVDLTGSMLGLPG